MCAILIANHFSSTRGFLAACLVLLGLACGAVCAADLSTQDFNPALCRAQPSAPYAQTASLTGRRVMVASADVRASAAGCKVLAQGGSAIDAAVAVQAVLGVVEPFASGLGGGSVISYFDAATGRVRIFDGLAAAPAAVGVAGTRSIYQMAVSSDLECRSGQALGGSLSAYQAHTDISGRATGVPGTVKVLDLVHQAYGRLPWRLLWDDAIGLAGGGFRLSDYLYATLHNPGQTSDDETGDLLKVGGVPAWWNLARNRWGPLRCQYPDIRARYCALAGTRPLPPDTMVTNLALANTMAIVRDGGAAAFYQPDGPIASAILQRFQRDLRHADGSPNCHSALPDRHNADGSSSTPIVPARIPSLMAAADFADYRAIERMPLVGQHFGFTVYTPPAPLFGGLVTLQSLALLERKNLAGLAFGTAAFYHLAGEASRLANADRRQFVGDPSVSNVDQRVRALLSSPYLDARAALVTDRALGAVAAGSRADGIPDYSAIDSARSGVRSSAMASSQANVALPLCLTPMGGGRLRPASGRSAVAAEVAEARPVHDEDWNTTSSLAVIDGWGNALAMTTTINTHWGAHIEAAGMMLNNAMSNFSAGQVGRDVNGYGPNRRPRSSIAPAIALDASGRLRLVWGAAGGGPIPDYIVKTFLGDLVYGLDLQAAINAGNWTGQGSAASVLQLDRGISGLIPVLRERHGHDANTLGVTGLNSGVAGISVTHDGPGGPLYRGAADARRAGGANGF